MKIIGLTGSIATGKSFVAETLRQRGLLIFSADKEVANLLQEKKVIDIISGEENLANAVKNNIIDKHILSNIVFSNNKDLKVLEDIIHPLISRKRQEFINMNQDQKALIFEIPLLFEKHYQNSFNKIITTYCSIKTQMERALRRKNIDNNRLNFIIKQQIPSNIKARLADYVIYTDFSYQYTREQVEQILLKEKI